jgi:ferric-dicitrate binding protein FerR (iron transport regulator)
MARRDGADDATAMKSLTAPTLRAPADRPAWRRGIRAPLAFVAVLGMLWAALNFRQV